MTDTEEAVNNQLTKKINIANKNIKLLMDASNEVLASIRDASNEVLARLRDMEKALEEKLEAFKTSTPQTQEEKEKIIEIFEKKGVEKPKGSFQEKQKQYLRLLRNGKIKEPKQTTLDYYKIVKDFDGTYELMVDALK